MTPLRPKALVSWSTGKDCAWALHEVQRAGELEVVGLLTTITEASGRVSMHEVPVELVERQAAALGLPLVQVPIPWPCPNEVYEERMGKTMAEAREQGVEGVVFGDLFLEDVRRYREQKLEGSGIEPLFPLWGRDTRELAEEMVAAGLRAVVTCVDSSQLAPSFVGRIFDEGFLRDLPEGADPCGENGELHTFAFAGPIFREPLAVKVGEVWERDGFVYAEVSGA